MFPRPWGEALYSSQPEKYSAHREPRGGGAAGMGPALSGEFLPEKAMVALYGSFDPATGKSRWAPSGAERERLKQFYDNGWYQLIDGRLLQTEHGSKWRAAYRVGEQEKMPKTEDGWRLERANRVMTMFREAPEFSLQGVEERGFIAVLTEPGSTAREWSSGLVLISDLEGQEGPDVVGTIPETEGGFCPGDEQDENASDCHGYTSEWKFVPDPEHSLPELVVTTRGSRLKAQDDRDHLDKDTLNEIEPFHEVRVFAFRSGEYTLISRQDVPPGEGTE
ncbi:hypothetical protein [Cystobacter fuscus]|uniref:hypothetical protein n=1 Tax=Cystobacter fuscus TaxID=43 RepID=UPI002B2E7CC4|nr:hypothetical protein F0U63_32980 [Cystobacter fuscus]